MAKSTRSATNTPTTAKTNFSGISDDGFAYASHSLYASFVMSYAKNYNSEDDLASVMNELSAAQGYQEAKRQQGESAASLETSMPLRLLPELDDYPDNTRCVGNSRGAVWNPFVNCDSVLPSSSRLSSQFVLPTNPHVEVLRRRVYEKFKKGFYQVMQDFQRESQQQVQLLLGMKKMEWPIPTLLEKWQMDAKSAEWQVRVATALKKQDNVKYHSATRPTEQRKQLPVLALTSEIARCMIEQQGWWIDPILLSPTFRTSSLFVQACQFEFQRCWKNDPKTKTLTPEQRQKLREVVTQQLPKQLKPVQNAIHKLMRIAVDSLHDDILRASSQLDNAHCSSNRNKNKHPKVRHNVERNPMMLAVTYHGLSFAIHAAHYEKLQRLYDRAVAATRCQQQQQHDDSYCGTFADALFCLLCRYDMLQGAGLQAAIPGNVHDVLLRHMDCRMECFASPLNCRYEAFGSAFDLDRLFGSVGSFFSIRPETGCFQANPPFCDQVIASMCEHITELLQQAEQHPDKKALMFVVFVPVWKEARGYQLLLESDFLTHQLVLNQGKHFYAEGSQFRRQYSFRVASFDTAILFFQNDRARVKWPVSQQLRSELEAAFTANPSKLRTSNGDNQLRKVSIGMERGCEAAAAAANELLQKQSDVPPKSLPGHKIPPVHASEMMINIGARKKLKPNKKRCRKNLDHQAQLDLLRSLGLYAAGNEATGAVEVAASTMTKIYSAKKRAIKANKKRRKK